MRKSTVMIVGPSQVGKSAAIKELVARYDFQFVTTYTTRAPRPEEIDGRDYHFLTQSRFQQLVLANEFIDWDYFLFSYGGIDRRTFEETWTGPKVLHVLARMALRLENRFPGTMTVFLAPEDPSVVYRRIRERFTDPLIAEARCAHVDEELLHAAMFKNVIRIGTNTSPAEVARRIHECWIRNEGGACGTTANGGV